MKKETIKITNNTGLHARPASNFTKLATPMPCDVFIKKGEKKINAKSVLGILSLAIGKDDIIEIITQGDKEEESLLALVKYVSELAD